MSVPPSVTPPRELVRASAGTGKTFRISSRIAGLLAHGAEPDAILASTFTRKAAGEILDRVLLRLAEAALDPKAAAELHRHARFPASPDGGGELPPVDPSRALELLGRLVDQLHRIDVGTLDSLFNRMARSFTLELGMLPGWTVADDRSPAARSLRSRAIGDVLSAGDIGTVVEMLRAASRGEATRRVHDRLAELVDDLQALHRELDPDASDPWSPFVVDRGPPEDPDAARRELARRLGEVDPPLNRNGTENKTWRDALETAGESLREGDWDSFWGKGPPKNFLSGDRTYARKPFPEELEEILGAARELRAVTLAAELDRQARALGRLARLYDEALEERQREARLYRFPDVAHRLAAASEPVAGRAELEHRMDRRARHVLLDEFQDTSPAQWRALRPLVDRIRAGDADPSSPVDGGRATVVVADPKQSIYGWRGAEPELVERVAQRYGLREDRLVESYRSSKVVLDVVNRVFGDVANNPVVAAVDEGAPVAREWARSFDAHEPAEPRRGEPGHARVEVGPDDRTRSSDRPLLMARCAERVAELHRRAPAASIGVLTRTNRAVARLIHELRERGVRAGEEGGTPVDDAAPVAALLSLLRLSDHPGDRIARYHVAATPLGEVIPYRDHRDEAGARRLARSVRRRLIRRGYGPALAEWAGELAPFVSDAEGRRLRQLVELGYRWEDRASLRPDEFVRFARAERVADPSDAPVQVMTVHQSKGLEFDAVFLPDLEESLTGGGRSGDTALPERDPSSGRIRRVFPYVKKDLRPLLPEIEEAARQKAAAEFRDELSWLYVAMTRARYALHVLVSADGESGPGRAKNPARLVRASLGMADEAVKEGDVLHEAGDPRWFEEMTGERGTGERGREPVPSETEPADTPLRIDPSRPRSRMLGRRTPSDLEGGDRVEPARLLRLDRSGAARRGDVVHRWCQEVGWMEEGLPDRAALLRLGRRAAPEMDADERRALAERFRGWMERTPVREALSRRQAGQWAAEVTGVPGPILELVTERRIAYREGEDVIAGLVDRLVLARTEEGGRVAAARILDFKTDDLDPGDERALDDRAARYHPQLRAYRRGIASLYGLDEDAVAARLLFLAPGAVREVD